MRASPADPAQGGAAPGKILAAVDGSPAGQMALQMAAELAGRMRAQLIGLFVEDQSLYKLAELPCTRQVHLPSGQASALAQDELRRGLLSHGLRLREAVGVAAERARADWTFEVRRGAVAAQVLEAAGQADLLVMGKEARHRGLWQRAGGGGLGSVTRQLLSAGRPLLLVPTEASLSRSATLLYDPAARAALLRSASWLRELGIEHFTVLLPAGSDEGDEGDELSARLSVKKAARITVRALPREAPQSAAALVEQLRVPGDTVLVLPAAGAAARAVGLAELVAAQRGPLLILPGGAERS